MWHSSVLSYKQPLTFPEKCTAGVCCLDALLPGQRALVSGLTTTGNMRRRLLDIGLTPGAEVVCLGCSPFGDPCAYLIRGAVVALRKKDCRHIRISAPQDRTASPADHVSREAATWD